MLVLSVEASTLSPVQQHALLDARPIGDIKNVIENLFASNNLFDPISTNLNHVNRS